VAFRLVRNGQTTGYAGVTNPDGYTSLENRLVIDKIGWIKQARAIAHGCKPRAGRKICLIRKTL